ncbi:MAG: small multi-drug export protein [Lachnospiraceae bacterium]|nr:small multi-drug export protein [Candidatus Darwinimomas equi]
MAEDIVKKIVASSGSLIAMKYGRQLIVFIISMMPILELRGGLIAASLMNMDPLESYIIAIVGNILPIPFILLFINKILEWMRNSKIRFINKFANWLYKKVDKHKEPIEKYGFWGLVLFVGIPLPGTGAWTGCLIASVLNMDKRKAFIASLIGVLMASIIMMIISFGIIGNIIR